MTNKIEFSEGKPSVESEDTKRGDFYYNTRQGIVYFVGAIPYEGGVKLRLFSMRDGMMYSSRGLFGKDNTHRNQFVKVNQSFTVNSHLDD